MVSELLPAPARPQNHAGRPASGEAQPGSGSWTGRCVTSTPALSPAPGSGIGCSCRRGWRAAWARPPPGALPSRSRCPFSATRPPEPPPFASRRGPSACPGDTRCSRTGMSRGTPTCRRSSRRSARCRSAPPWRPSAATWPAARRSSPAWRATSTTTARCTRTCAPCAGAPSPRRACWTCTSSSGTTRSSSCWPSGRACTSAWWRAARPRSAAAASARSTWCARTATRPTSASTSPAGPGDPAGRPPARKPWRWGRPRPPRAPRPAASPPPSASAKGPRGASKARRKGASCAEPRAPDPAPSPGARGPAPGAPDPAPSPRSSGPRPAPCRRGGDTGRALCPSVRLGPREAGGRAELPPLPAKPRSPK